MNKYIFHSLLILVSSAFSEVKQPNVLILLVDDMGLMYTSVPFVVDEDKEPKQLQLNELYRTPNMMNLANNGVRFSRFYANSVCSPSRVSLLNGQYSARHGVTQWIHPMKRNRGGNETWNWEGLTSESVSITKILKEAGYTTMHCGKAHWGPFDHEGANPLNLHFDINIAGDAMGQPASYYGKESFKRGNSQVPHLEKYHGTDIFLTNALTEEAKLKISDFSKTDEPFFLHMSHYALHSPFQADPKYLANYKELNLDEKHKAFATLVEGIDHSLGELIVHLERVGEADNTLIVFLGDNGSDAPIGGKKDYYKVSSSAPYKGRKATCYEGGMLAPLIVSWAKPNPDSAIQKKFPIKPGIVTEDFVTICDIMPTLLNITGTEAPETHPIDGQDLSSYLATHEGTHSQEFLMHFPHVHRSVNFTVFRDQHWKLIKHYRAEKDQYELFNLEIDPYEQKNLAKSHPAELAKLCQKMSASLTDCSAQFYTPNTP